MQPADIRCDVAVIGGGIVGVSTAWHLARSGRHDVLVLEAEPELASHQSGRNSGVVHAGLYYRPGSSKAELCRKGREQLLQFCESRNIAYRPCGKLVIATRESELKTLDELADRARANGQGGLRSLDASGIRDIEPHARGLAGLAVPQTGVVDFAEVTRALAGEFEEAGGSLRTASRVTSIEVRKGLYRISTARGVVSASWLVNCAGLQSDRVARLCGLDPGVSIIPFRGEYYSLVDGSKDLVRALIYPVPDPDLPFLGAHFTRSIDDQVEAGPNAVLAFRREGYSRTSFSWGDAAGIFSSPGFWRLARRFWRPGMAETYRSWHKPAFVRALQQLVPEITSHDLARGTSGVRAQAVDPLGRLLDDFHIVRGNRSVHVLNAPSPAATASLAIGRHIAEMIES